MSEDPLERRLRDLLQGEVSDLGSQRDDRRLDRVLHKAHVRGGLFDLVNLFARWGWVLSEGSVRGARHLKPVSRDSAKTSTQDINQQ
ncbi:CrfX protein [Halopseudomonas sp.]|uniref:CrfX protein n=1 Tax=Halopseudomonas sp. TaxID=2901191 RepID=UPI003002EF9E